MFLAVAVVAVLATAASFFIHFDDPFAVVTLPDNPATPFTQDAALELTASALRLAGLEPIRPEPAYGRDGDPERFIGRNTLRPEDLVSVIWNVRGGSYSAYTVTLDRTPTQIRATISENRL
jgi:hypothetical protein